MPIQVTQQKVEKGLSLNALPVLTLSRPEMARFVGEFLSYLGKDTKGSLRGVTFTKEEVETVLDQLALNPARERSFVYTVLTSRPTRDGRPLVEGASPFSLNPTGDRSRLQKGLIVVSQRGISENVDATIAHEGAHGERNVDPNHRQRSDARIEGLNVRQKLTGALAIAAVDSGFRADFSLSSEKFRDELNAHIVEGWAAPLLRDTSRVNSAEQALQAAIESAKKLLTPMLSKAGAKVTFDWGIWPAEGRAPATLFIELTVVNSRGATRNAIFTAPLGDDNALSNDDLLRLRPILRAR